MIDYLRINWIEITGVVFSLIYLFLSIREKSALWFFGFLSSLLYIWVFFHSKLYAEISLQLYYLIISVYGWITWQRKSEVTHNKSLVITRTTSQKQFVHYSLSAVGVFFV